MFNTSFSNVGTIIMDIAAVLMVLGMIFHTTLYRKRGKPEDMLFFYMLLVVLVSAVFDGINFSLEQSTWDKADFVILMGDTLFSLCFTVLPYLFVLFLHCRVVRDEKRLNRMAAISAVPLFLMAFFILGNLPWGYMFTVEHGTNIYSYGPLYNVIFIPTAIYGVVALVLMWQRPHRFSTIGMFILLVIVRTYLGGILRGVSSTSFVLAIGLAYAHICVMNDEFYRETGEAPLTRKKGGSDSW